MWIWEQSNTSGLRVLWVPIELSRGSPVPLFSQRQGLSLSSWRYTGNRYREGTNGMVPSLRSVLLRLLLPLGTAVLPYRLPPKGCHPLFSVDVLSPLSCWSIWLSYLLGACICLLVYCFYCLCTGLFLFFFFFTILKVFYKGEELKLEGHSFTGSVSQSMNSGFRNGGACETVNRSCHPHLKTLSVDRKCHGHKWHRATLVK